MTRPNNEQDIGDLLLKVQDELKGLRTLIGKDGAKIDLKHLQTSLAKVENEIKEKTDTIINNLNSQVESVTQINEEKKKKKIKLKININSFKLRLKLCQYTGNKSY